MKLITTNPKNLLPFLACLVCAATAAADTAGFKSHIQPFLKQHCVRCHGPNREEGGVRVDQLKWDLEDIDSIEELQNILDEIVIDSMPPEEEPRPRSTDLEAVTKILNKHINTARDKYSSGGGKPVRRLSKTEYVNTIEDLLGVKVDSSEMAEDSIVGSFDTVALDLYTTDMHLETCFKVSKEAVRSFISSRNVPPGKKSKDAKSAHVPQAYAFFKKFSKYDDRAPDSAAKEVLLAFAQRMNRGREVDQAMIGKLVTNFRLGRKQGENFWEALVTPMALTMCTIEAMFHFETRGKAADSKYVSPVEMVNRVSYFLWRSAPDEELLSLAKSKKWYDPKVRAQQFRRMMADRRFDRFLTDFSVQWLELDRQDEIAVNPQIYHDFDPEIKPALKQETVEFLSRIIRENMPIKTLIESDFVMVNDVVAKHYGFPPVNGSKFRPIPVPRGSKRGGLLTQAGIAMQGGTGDRSSIVERGAFVARKLLNDPPPPPPPLVSELPTEGEAVTKSTAAEMVLRHRKAPQCASCHKTIDSIGIGMEELDAVGRYRNAEKRLNPDFDKLGKKQRKNPKSWTIEVPLETSGSLDGKKFQTVAGLKKVLLTKQDKVAEAYLEALLTLANGRKAGVVDKAIVQDIIKRAQRVEFPAQSILIAVLQSDAFRVH